MINEPVTAKLSKRANRAASLSERRKKERFIPLGLQDIVATLKFCTVMAGVKMVVVVLG